MKIDLTGVKGAIASILIVLSLLVGILNAVQGALPPTVESLGASNFDTLQVGDGTVSEPAFGFTSDTDTGVYRVGSNNIGLAVGGSKIVDVSSGGLQVDTITATNLISQVVSFLGENGNITDTLLVQTATVTGTATAGALEVGGAYSGGSGCTLSAAGVLQCNGAATTDGPLTAASAAIGGGYASTGVDLTSAGDANIAGKANIDGALVVTGTSTFGNVMTVNANGDFDSISVAGNSDVTTINNTGANPVTINDDLTITGTVIYSSASITPTDGGTLTPTASLVTLTPAGAVGVDLGACTTGNLTTLYNSVNANVVITDTGNGILAGDQTLGQYDILPLACFDSKWVQTGPVSSN